MKFRCPNPSCSEAVTLGDASCSRCGQLLTFKTILGLNFKALWSAFKATSTRCPGCRSKIPFVSKLCPQCGDPVTFSGALDATVKPTRSAAGEFFRGLGPEAQRVFRWTYVVVSALLFWALLSPIERAWSKPNGAAYAALAVVYLAFLYLFFLWVVPRPLRVRVAKQIRMATKIAFIFNFFSLLMLVFIFIEQYWGKATKIALLFGITFAGFWIFTTFIRNLWLELAADWRDVTAFSHLGNQGRSARYD